MLAYFARTVIRRYHPKIVMVTGSVGKTSTKDAVAAVLSAKYFTRKSEKSFNSEIGVPLTILGVGNPWSNPVAWLSLIGNAFALMFLPNHYPTLLVLETGADKPGDLARILKIATPDVVVVTRLPDIPVHVEAYASPEAVQEEEFSPARALSQGAPLIVSAEDTYALENALQTQAKVITYGTTEDAQVRLSHIRFYQEGKRVTGMCATVRMGEEEGEAVVRGSVGEVQMLPVAAALAAAKAFDIPLKDALASLENYVPPAGRGRLLEGKKDCVIIDDSYNSSPAAVEEALDTLKRFPKAGRRIAVLGDMLELGRYSVMEHQRIGSLVGKAADVVAAVGIRARAFAIAAGEAKVLAFDNSRAAAAELPNFVEPGDVVLIKGSQSMRMERIVHALLANPSDVSRLVRQDRRWIRK